jgi:hypothetical protein
VGDVFGDHRFAEAVGAEQEKVASFGNELQGEGGFNEVAVDFLGPVPVEVGDGLEAAEVSVAQAPFDAAPGAVLKLLSGELIEKSSW